MSHQLKLWPRATGESKSRCCTRMSDCLFCWCYAVIESGSRGMDGLDLLMCVGEMQENGYLGYFFDKWWERDNRDNEY